MKWKINAAYLKNFSKKKNKNGIHLFGEWKNKNKKRYPKKENAICIFFFNMSSKY